VSDNIFRYFPSLSGDRLDKLSRLQALYTSWNSRINVISRKDMDNFMVHHVLHSLSIAKIASFGSGTRILDVGTGGGFPGIPLAILFPDAEFTLLDSIGKKIMVVSSVAGDLGLKNVIPVRKRVEDEKGKYHFIVSRAVTRFPEFVKMTKKNIGRSDINELRNGIIYLKGGDLAAETGEFKDKLVFWNIKDFFNEPFFETKLILYLPL
jgi:16S rRNA (guanine527-N7)-methyltransferase